jgi:hypothetical protein
MDDTGLRSSQSERRFEILDHNEYCLRFLYDKQSGAIAGQFNPAAGNQPGDLRIRVNGIFLAPCPSTK